jgi:hypothetical protein
MVLATAAFIDVSCGERRRTFTSRVDAVAATTQLETLSQHLEDRERGFCGPFGRIVRRDPSRFKTRISECLGHLGVLLLLLLLRNFVDVFVVGALR